MPRQASATGLVGSSVGVSYLRSDRLVPVSLNLLCTTKIFGMRR